MFSEESDKENDEDFWWLDLSFGDLQSMRNYWKQLIRTDRNADHHKQRGNF